MISKVDAETRVLEKLNEPDPYAPDSPRRALLNNETIERPWGWVFFYESAHFLETGRFEDRLAGNAPCLFNRFTGEIAWAGTAHPIGHYIEQYEQQLTKNA
mgnify:CR=1 FL=1